MAESKQPESASLLRRLAEAADGYRNGVAQIIIARRVHPHDVADVLPATDLAGIDRALTQAGPGFETFGPYLTPAETFVNADHDVDFVTVTFKRNEATGTKAEDQVFRASEYDALIWGISAYDKLVMPYLTSVSGFDHAAKERAKFVAGSTVGHKLHSF
jgi:hypothetical protein